MKKLSLLLVITAGLMFFSCSKDKKSERFIILTTPIWTADSLLANGMDASGPGQMLEKFKGDAKFQEDGTGYFGTYTGIWKLYADDTEIIIMPDNEPMSFFCDIVELTVNSLKIKTSAPNQVNPSQPIPIRMTFKVK
ncbi:MAG: hypothetical protein MUC93_04760 [Bacteroidales bacterium]|jgi:hypothetical protein|nr:hypothetical protein [Bacteroidales bacterium]